MEQQREAARQFERLQHVRYRRTPSKEVRLEPRIRCGRARARDAQMATCRTHRPHPQSAAASRLRGSGMSSYRPRWGPPDRRSFLPESGSNSHEAPRCGHNAYRVRSPRSAQSCDYIHRVLAQHVREEGAQLAVVPTLGTCLLNPALEARSKRLVAGSIHRAGDGGRDKV
jgi:hypothetical protein